MIANHYPVTQDMSKGIVMAAFTVPEWEALRVAVNRIAVSDEPTDDGAHVVWRQCRILADQMHG